MLRSFFLCINGEKFYFTSMSSDLSDLWPSRDSCHDPSCFSVTISVKGKSSVLFRQDEIEQRHSQSPHVRGYSDRKHPKQGGLILFTKLCSVCLVRSHSLCVTKGSSAIVTSVFILLTPPNEIQPSFPGTGIELISVGHCLPSNSKIPESKTSDFVSPRPGTVFVTGRH